MIQVTDNSLIITINAGSPLEELSYLRKGLINVVKAINPNINELQPTIIEDIQHVAALLQQMELSPSQMGFLQNQVNSSEKHSQEFNRANEAA